MTGFKVDESQLRAAKDDVARTRQAIAEAVRRVAGEVSGLTRDLWNGAAAAAFATAFE
ncbi:MAG: WXG100 family type VII secretion target, partial [Frankiaceae bacterium]|nr:WXG100 family type VII secretion target [Frankiaceae bacterium]